MTDPARARSTKEELLPCPFCGAAALLEDDDAGCMNDQCILACFAYPLERWNRRADAADALRAQVAALQAELAAAHVALAKQKKLSAAISRDCNDCANERNEARAELAAAQAKLAVPVDGQNEVLLACCDLARHANFVNERGHVVGTYSAPELANRLRALARDNAALRAQLQDERENHAQLQARCYEGFPTFSSVFDEYAAIRTKAEALERERDGLDHNTTFYDVTTDAPVLGGNVPTLASVSKRIWYHATDDQDSYPFSAVIAAAIAEKP